MRNALVTLIVSVLGTVLGGWALVWLPADAARVRINALGEVANPWTWVTAPIQMPAWYFMVSALLYIGAVVFIGLKTVEFWRRADNASLTDEDCKVLQSIYAGEEVGIKPTVAQLCRHSGLSKLKVEHSLDRLHAREMIHDLWSIYDDTKYYLSAEGRAFLVSNGNS